MTKKVRLKSQLLGTGGSDFALEANISFAPPVYKLSNILHNFEIPTALFTRFLRIEV